MEIKKKKEIVQYRKKRTNEKQLFWTCENKKCGKKSNKN